MLIEDNCKWKSPWRRSPQHSFFFPLWTSPFHSMPLCLKKAPQTLQLWKYIVLSSVKGQFSFVYLDDILIFWVSRRTKMPCTTSTEVIERPLGRSKKMKCEFFTNSIEYRAHVIKISCLEIESHTPDLITSLQESSYKTTPTSFFGLCNVLRQFVPNFAGTAAPLNHKLRK